MIYKEKFAPYECGLRKETFSSFSLHVLFCCPDRCALRHKKRETQGKAPYFSGFRYCPSFILITGAPACVPQPTLEYSELYPAAFVIIHPRYNIVKHFFHFFGLDFERNPHRFVDLQTGIRSVSIGDTVRPSMHRSRFGAAHREKRDHGSASNLHPSAHSK